MEENYYKNSSTRVDSTFDYLSPSPSLFRTYIEITMYSVPEEICFIQIPRFPRPRARTLGPGPGLSAGLRDSL